MLGNPTIYLKFAELNNCLIHVTSSKPVFIDDNFISDPTGEKDIFMLMKNLLYSYYGGNDFTCSILIDPMYQYLSNPIKNLLQKYSFSFNITIGEKF